MTTTKGIITGVENLGSIITVWVSPDDEDKPELPVNFDHRMFHHFAKDVDGPLVGLAVEYDSDDMVITILEEGV